MIDVGLYAMYLLLVVAAVTAAVFPLLYMVKNIQEAKKTLMGLGGLFVIFIFSYLAASGNVLPEWEKFNISPTESKFIGGMLISLYTMLVLSAVVLVYSEVKNLLK